MNKVALVTGGTRGIGLGIAKALLEEGYKVAIVSRKKNNVCERDLQSHKDSFCFIQGDISRGEHRLKILNDALEAFGRIDVLVNNAGIAPRERCDLLDLTEDSMQEVMNVNLMGTFFLTQIVAKHMMKQNSEGEYRIINISSISAYTSSINRGEYCISKAGLSMATKLFADRLAISNIKVFEIRPGIIHTDMTAGVKEKYDNLIDKGLTPIKRWGEPEDVANMVTLLCSHKVAFSTGDVFNVDGGFHLRRL